MINRVRDHQMQSLEIIAHFELLLRVDIAEQNIRSLLKRGRNLRFVSLKHVQIGTQRSTRREIVDVSALPIKSFAILLLTPAQKGR